MPVPWWYEVLEIAKDWGLPPWEVAPSVGGDHRALWILRRRVVKRVKENAELEKSKHKR